MVRLDCNTDGGTQAAVHTVTLWSDISVSRGAKMPAGRPKYLWVLATSRVALMLLEMYKQKLKVHVKYSPCMGKLLTPWGKFHYQAWGVLGETCTERPWPRSSGSSQIRKTPSLSHSPLLYNRLVQRYGYISVCKNNLHCVIFYLLNINIKNKCIYLFHTSTQIRNSEQTC